MENLNELLKKILNFNIDFVIVGGFAGVVHGATQVTQDLDICLLIDEQKINDLRECLKDLNPKHRMLPQKPSFLDTPDASSDIKNLYLETNLGIIDILSEVPNIGSFKRIKDNSITVQLFGHNCQVISLDDLIEVKKNLGRAKDIALYHELLEIKNKPN